MGKTLFFFTASYPFGHGETFIENEIEYLAKAFDKVIIISNNTNDQQTRKVPSNCILYRLPYELSKTQKLFSYVQLTNPLFWQEFNIIKNTYGKKITLPIVNTMLQTLQKAKVFYPFIYGLLKKEGADVDNAYFYSYWNNDMAFSLAYFKNKNAKIKAFSRMHRWDIYFEENKINYLPYRDYIFKNLDRVFSISKDGILYTRNILSNCQIKIELSRLGVKKQIAKKEGSLKNLKILTISNLIPVKNIEHLILALNKIDINYTWTHIGEGPLKNELETKAINTLGKKVCFLGKLSNHDVMKYLKHNTTDLFINISLSEGIPVSIMEAMSFSIPVIATNVGGNSEIVDDLNGKLLSSKPTIDDISKAIMDFYNLSIEQKRQKRKAAQNTWNQNYNAERNYTNFIKEINQL